MGKKMDSEARKKVEAEVETALLRGDTISQIKESIPGSHPRLISEITQKLGVKGRRASRVVEKERRVQEMHASGQTMTQIAVSLKISTGAVANVMRRLQIPTTQEVRPITIVGIGVVSQPKIAIEKLRELFPEMQWTLARVIK